MTWKLGRAVLPPHRHRARPGSVIAISRLVTGRSLSAITVRGRRRSRNGRTREAAREQLGADDERKRNRGPDGPIGAEAHRLAGRDPCRAAVPPQRARDPVPGGERSALGEQPRPIRLDAAEGDSPPARAGSRSLPVDHLLDRGHPGSRRRSRAAATSASPPGWRSPPRCRRRSSAAGPAEPVSSPIATTSAVTPSAVASSAVRAVARAAARRRPPPAAGDLPEQRAGGHARRSPRSGRAARKWLALPAGVRPERHPGWYWMAKTGRPVTEPLTLLSLRFTSTTRSPPATPERARRRGSGCATRRARRSKTGWFAVVAAPERKLRAPRAGRGQVPETDAEERRASSSHRPTPRRAAPDRRPGRARCRRRRAGASRAGVRAGRDRPRPFGEGGETERATPKSSASRGATVRRPPAPARTTAAGLQAVPPGRTQVAHLGTQRRGVAPLGGEHAPHLPMAAQPPHDRADVEAFDRGHAVRAQVAAQPALGGAVGGLRGELPGHDPRGAGPVRLGPARAHSVVAEVRLGHHHDLPGGGGVGEDLLIAAHRGMEDDLAEAGTGRHGSRREDRSVREHEEGVVGGSREHRVVRGARPRAGGV